MIDENTYFALCSASIDWGLPVNEFSYSTPLKWEKVKFDTRKEIRLTTAIIGVQTSETVMLEWTDFQNMMTSSNGNIFRVTVPLCMEFTAHWRIPRTMASDTELWCFLDLRLNKR